MKNRRRLTIEHKYKLKNSTFTENDTDELIDKVHRENQEYQKNRITDEERINMLITIGEILSDERDEDNKEFDEKYKELGFNKFFVLFVNLKD